MKLHVLKILNNYFEQIVADKKLFEIRFNDKDFQVHDLIHFVDKHGNEFEFFENNVYEITYVLKDCEDYGLMNGFAIFSIKEVKLI